MSLVGELRTRHAPRSRSRPRAGAARSAITLAKPCAICAATLLEELVRRTEVGLQLARDEHTERDAVADERKAAIAGRPLAGVHVDRLAARAPTRSPPTPCTGYICAIDVDRELQVARRDRRAWSRSSPARAGTTASSSSTSSARFGARLPASRSQAARLDRVEPGDSVSSRRSGAAHGFDSEQVGEAFELAVDFARRSTSKSSGRSRIASSSRSTSGGVG